MKINPGSYKLVFLIRFLLKHFNKGMALFCAIGLFNRIVSSNFCES
jgi:GT2 family glycosyltransferase